MAHRSERGSVLALVPAGVLVLLILAAICVDFSTAELARQQLRDAASGAANDAAGAALDEARLRAGDGRVTIDPERARAVAEQSLAVSVHAPVRLTSPPEVDVAGDRVVVTLEGDAPYLFAPAVGGHRRVHVRAQASAVLRTRGPSAAPASR